MKIKLIFFDWLKAGKSVYNTKEGIILNSGDFHSGTTFSGEIKLDEEQTMELKQHMKLGYQPVFWVALGKEENEIFS